MVMNAFLSLLLFVCSILLHELGHYFALYLFGFKNAVIKITGQGFTAGDNVYLKLKVYEYLLVLLAGISFGLWFAMLNPIFAFFYLFVCVSDVSNFLEIFYDRKVKFNDFLFDYIKRKCSDVNKQYEEMVKNV